MEERAWVRPNQAGQMQFACGPSSEGRSFAGFDVKIYHTSGGFFEAGPRVHHGIAMHIGAPITATCRCDGLEQRRSATLGDIDIIPSSFSAAWEEDGPTTYLAIQLKSTLLLEAARDMGLDTNHVSIAPQLQLRDPKLEHIAWALKEEIQGPELHGRLYADSLGLALAARLLQLNVPVTPPPLERFSKRKLRNVIDYIHDNLALDLSLAELAVIAGLSTSHFKSLFKEATNLPVHQYIIHRRVEYAISLLLRGKSSLNEVASQAGFSDQSHMARCMRRVAGVTPAVVKRNHE